MSDLSVPEAILLISFSQVFEGKRVGVIGSGSSSIQIVPALQKLKDIHLTCFVRSKTWIARPFADPIMKDLELESYECRFVRFQKRKPGHSRAK